ncbi:multi-pass transmembrane protein [Cardiosporidium cionae]|uniref:Multi-pass transmembrane protein n=1 Tax=Cardiosporidium cionae TaxID=476202 RepID=A0ABQ7JFV3_9APIC|nr:multi-pass transmembrane protein [Cardiosporidium cionae]|eukprot:KAF8822764.1 multi-pass transmembrane protein [Cardiosporidium cionae]
MYFTYVVRPGEAPEGRSPQYIPFFEFLYNFYLRISFLLQLVAYFGLLLCAFAGNTKSVSLLWLLRAHPETMGNAPILGVLIFSGTFIIANVLTLAFVTVEDDDSSIKQSRGFRAGVKFFDHSALFGTLAWSLTLISFFAANSYFDDDWFKYQIGGGSDWLLYFSARSCDVIALFLAAGGLFFQEAYHSEGVGEAKGWICGSLLKFTAFSEIIALCLYGSEAFHIADTVYTTLLGISLTLSCIWAWLFEPVSHRYDVKLSQSVIRNEYYKSRNAMAYYGPAVINAEGEVDIQAATQQAQASLNSGCCS